MKRRKLHVRKSSSSGPRGVSWETACPQSAGFCCNLNVFLKCRRQGSCLAPVVCWFELLQRCLNKSISESHGICVHTRTHMFQPLCSSLAFCSGCFLDDIAGLGKPKSPKETETLPLLCSFPSHYQLEAGSPQGGSWVARRACVPPSGSPSVLYSWWPQGREAPTPVTPALLWASGVWCL